MKSKRPNTSVDEPIEIGLIGDLTEHETVLTDKLLSVPVGGRCTLYIDSPGGSPYCAMSLATIILLRKIRATAFVTGECSSATLWPFAACVNRYVTPFSVLLFHPMKWQSEEHVGLHEASEWARHFGKLEEDMDEFLCSLFQKSQGQVSKWIKAGRYVNGPELAEAGLAKMIQLTALTDVSLLAGNELNRVHSAAKLPNVPKAVSISKTSPFTKIPLISKMPAAAKAPTVSKSAKSSKAKNKRGR